MRGFGHMIAAELEKRINSAERQIENLQGTALEESANNNEEEVDENAMFTSAN